MRSWSGAVLVVDLNFDVNGSDSDVEHGSE